MPLQRMCGGAGFKPQCARSKFGPFLRSCLLSAPPTHSPRLRVPCPSHKCAGVWHGAVQGQLNHHGAELEFRGVGCQSTGGQPEDVHEVTPVHTAVHTVDTSRQLAAAVPPLTTAAAPVAHVDVYTHTPFIPTHRLRDRAHTRGVYSHASGLKQCCLGRLETAAVIDPLPATHRTSPTTRPLPQRQGWLLAGSSRASPTHMP